MNSEGRLRAATITIPAPLAGGALRASLEEAAQVALDAADRIVAALDRIDGDTSEEPGFTAMAAHHEQVFRFREPQPKPEPIPVAIDLAEPEAVAEPGGGLAEPELVFEPIRLPWRGAGNVVSAAGCAVLKLVARRT